MARNSKLKFIVPALILAVLILPIAFLIMFSMGSTFGEEFSPDDFSRRSFYYNRLPIVKWTLIGKQFDDLTSDFEKSLILDGFIKPISNSPKTWHLNSDGGGIDNNRISSDCDARFLVDYLQLPGDDTVFYWEQWNTDHPKHATVFWPVVADLARSELYLAIPDIMRLALSVDEVETEISSELGDVEVFTLRLEELVEEAHERFGK